MKTFKSFIRLNQLVSSKSFRPVWNLWYLYDVTWFTSVSISAIYILEWSSVALLWNKSVKARHRLSLSSRPPFRTFDEHMKKHSVFTGVVYSLTNQTWTHRNDKLFSVSMLRIIQDIIEENLKHFTAVVATWQLVHTVYCRVQHAMLASSRISSGYFSVHNEILVAWMDELMNISLFFIELEWIHLAVLVF